MSDKKPLYDVEDIVDFKSHLDGINSHVIGRIIKRVEPESSIYRGKFMYQIQVLKVNGAQARGENIIPEDMIRWRV